MSQYRLTDEELNELIAATQPVPYLVIGGFAPESPTEKSMRIWTRVAKRVGCQVETIDAADTGDQHDFIAEPLPST